jgi:hypothetical protein
MNLQAICEQYAAFRKTLGERFETNGRKLFARSSRKGYEDSHIAARTCTGCGWAANPSALRGFSSYPAAVSFSSFKIG